MSLYCLTDADSDADAKTDSDSDLIKGVLRLLDAGPPTALPVGRGPPEDAGLLPQLLLGEDLHGVVDVVLLVVGQLHDPIASLAHNTLRSSR